MSTYPDVEPVIRRCDPDELKALRADLCALAVRSKASWGYDDDFMLRFAELEAATFDTPDLGVFVAHVGEALVGFAAVEIRDELAWLEDLWIEPSWQGRGIGTSLLRTVLGASRDAGCLRVECESDPHAEAFYVSQGAHRYAERPSTLAAGRTLPLMRWELACT